MKCNLQCAFCFPTGGVLPHERAQVWQFLFGMYPSNSTALERPLIQEQMVVRYQVMKKKWQHVFPGAVHLQLNGTDGTWLISYPSNHITLQLYVPLAMQWPCTCLTLLLLYQCGVCVIPLPLLLLFSLVPATNSWACSCSGVFSPAAGTYSEGGLSAVWRNVWEDVLFRASDSGKEKSSVFLSSF